MVFRNGAFQNSPWIPVQLNEFVGWQCVLTMHFHSVLKSCCSSATVLCFVWVTKRSWAMMSHKVWFHFVTLSWCFCPSGKFTTAMCSVWCLLISKRCNHRVFFFLCWRTHFWLLRHLLFPGWGSDAYYSPLICPAIKKPLEAVTDCTGSDMISGDM